MDSIDTFREKLHTIPDRAWVIKDGYFQRRAPNCTSHNFVKIERYLKPIRHLFWQMGCSLYIRGSIIEEPYPFDASDIDFFLIGPPEATQKVIEVFMGTLSPHFKAIDVVPLTREAVQENIVFRLLIHTRSLILAGPKVDFPPVPADWKTAHAHWKLFNIEELTDYIDADASSNACMVKNLLRAIAILYLPQQQFSRHLPTCLKWGLKIAPPEIQDALLTSFFFIGKRQQPPVDIRLPKRWLIEQWSQIQRW